MIQTRSYDAANYLRDEADCAGYLSAVMNEASASSQEIAAALADIARARARGMLQIARDAGVSRQLLDQTFFSHGTPALDALIKAIRALGLRLTVQPDVLMDISGHSQAAG